MVEIKTPNLIIHIITNAHCFDQLSEIARSKSTTQIIGYKLGHENEIEVIFIESAILMNTTHIIISTLILNCLSFDNNQY